MKRIVLSLVILSAFNTIKAQEAADKKVQAGLAVGAGMNFTNPTTKYITRNGVGSDLTVGMNLNYNFSPTIGLSTGIEFDFESFKYKTDSSLFYVFKDAQIFTKSHYANQESIFSSQDKVYKLTDRKEKPIYLTIPVMMLFRTKFIGYFRYFGKFGLRNSFLLSNTITDQGGTVSPTHVVSTLSNEHMKVSTRDLALYKGFIGLSGGAEWNFSGTTSLVAEIGYYYGFLNISRGKALTGDDEKNMSVITGLDSNNKPTGFSSMAAKQSQLLLKVAILF